MQSACASNPKPDKYVRPIANNSFRINKRRQKADICHTVEKLTLPAPRANSLPPQLIPHI